MTYNRPDTAGEDTQVHASLSINVTLNSTYPSSPADVEVERVVGLSDEDVEELRCALAAAAIANIGEAPLPRPASLELKHSHSSS
jgi:hypothetical protein